MAKNSSLKAVYDGPYFKPAAAGSPKGTKGTQVYRYKVVGNPADLKAYKDAQSATKDASGKSVYREDEETKEPLWFTSNVLPKVIGLGVTRPNALNPKGKVFADTGEIERLRKMSIQYPETAEDNAREIKEILKASPNTVAQSAPVTAKAAETLDQE